jgi:hypothetical protein
MLEYPSKEIPCQETHNILKESHGQSIDVGIPMTIFLWQYFHGNMEAMANSVRVGDSWQKVDKDHPHKIH